MQNRLRVPSQSHRSGFLMRPEVPWSAVDMILARHSYRTPGMRSSPLLWSTQRLLTGAFEKYCYYFFIKMQTSGLPHRPLTVVVLCFPCGTVAVLLASLCLVGRRRSRRGNSGHPHTNFEQPSHGRTSFKFHIND